MLGKGRRGRAALVAFAATLVLARAAGAASGDLDPRFASDGRLAVPAVGPFVARAVAVDGADRIVVAGYLCERSRDATCLQDGDTNVRIARLTPDGGLDPEFGEGGIVTTAMGDGRSQAFDLAVQPDGAIVAGGVARLAGRDVFALARYRTDGGLDPGFGDGGTTLLPAGSSYASIGDVELGPGGTILTAGQAVDAAGLPRMAIARLTAAGAPDPAFGTGGVTLGGPGPGAYGYGLALGVTPAGTAVAAGVAGDSSDSNTFRFADLVTSPAGAIVRASQHRVGTASSFANALTLLPGGDVLAAGTATDAAGNAAMATVRSDLAGRHVRSRLFALRGPAVANDVLPGPHGGAWLVGHMGDGDGFDFATVRLDARGARQRSIAFGWADYPIARATAGALQRSGRLVTVGIGCADGTGMACAGGAPVLLLARQLGGQVGPIVAVPRAISRADLLRGLRVRVRLTRPARVDVRLTAHGRVLRRVRTATRRTRVTLRLRLRARAARGPLHVIVRAGRESVTRTVALRR